MSTPKPPYTYPQQKPTRESGDNDGDIYVRGRDEFGQFVGYQWRHPMYLKDGDIWVPGCDAFWEDHGEEQFGALTKRAYANGNWTDE